MFGLTQSFKRALLSSSQNFQQLYSLLFLLPHQRRPLSLCPRSPRRFVSSQQAAPQSLRTTIITVRITSTWSPTPSSAAMRFPRTQRRPRKGSPSSEETMPSRSRRFARSTSRSTAIQLSRPRLQPVSISFGDKQNLLVRQSWRKDAEIGCGPINAICNLPYFYKIRH